MQDIQTGMMHEIPAEFHKLILDREALSKAMAATIPVERQGAIWREGEMVEVKGAKFRIQKIIKKGLVLHAVKST